MQSGGQTSSTPRPRRSIERSTFVYYPCDLRVRGATVRLFCFLAARFSCFCNKCKAGQIELKEVFHESEKILHPSCKILFSWFSVTLFGLVHLRMTWEYCCMTQEMVAAGVPAKDIDKVLIPRPLPCPENLSVRWCQRFLRAFNWRKVSRNTAGNYLVSWLLIACVHIVRYGSKVVSAWLFFGAGFRAKEWSDPRLIAARKGVHDKINQHGVHRFLVLNIDQVWRQALRFSKTLFIKGKHRRLTKNGHGMFSFTSMGNPLGLQVLCHKGCEICAVPVVDVFFCNLQSYRIFINICNIFIYIFIVSFSQSMLLISMRWIYSGLV